MKLSTLVHIAVAGASMGLRPRNLAYIGDGIGRKHRAAKLTKRKRKIAEQSRRRNRK